MKHGARCSVKAIAPIMNNLCQVIEENDIDDDKKIKSDDSDSDSELDVEVVPMLWITLIILRSNWHAIISTGILSPLSIGVRRIMSAVLVHGLSNMILISQRMDLLRTLTRFNLIIDRQSSTHYSCQSILSF